MLFVTPLWPLSFPLTGPPNFETKAVCPSGCLARLFRFTRLLLSWGYENLRVFESSTGKGRWRKRKGIAKVRLPDGHPHCHRESLVGGDRD
jgi:hypothetical protein